MLPRHEIAAAHDAAAAGIGTRIWALRIADMALARDGLYRHSAWTTPTPQPLRVQASGVDPRLLPPTRRSRAPARAACHLPTPRCAPAPAHEGAGSLAAPREPAWPARPRTRARAHGVRHDVAYYLLLSASHRGGDAMVSIVAHVLFKCAVAALVPLVRHTVAARAPLASRSRDAPLVPIRGRAWADVVRSRVRSTAPSGERTGSPSQGRQEVAGALSGEQSR